MHFTSLHDGNALDHLPSSLHVMTCGPTSLRPGTQEKSNRSLGRYRNFEPNIRVLVMYGGFGHVISAIQRGN